MSLTNNAKTLSVVAALMAAMSLAGCGDGGLVDGIAFNGKIFDAVGLNTGSVKSGDPKIAQREPLTIPPGLDSLPPPGSGKADAPTLAEVQDPDVKAKLSHAELEKQQADYCSKNYAPAVQRGDETADLVTGPLGPCRGSIFNVVKGYMTKDDSADDSTN